MKRKLQSLMKNQKKMTRLNEKWKENYKVWRKTKRKWQGLMKNEKKTTKSEEKPKENDKA